MADQFRAGDLVEVRSQQEILATLDATGRLDGLPFMPEMLAACGQRFRVYRRAHKTCDTVRGAAGLRMNDAVHLEGSRCNGSAHGGCQAECLVFWKYAWLKRVDQDSPIHKSNTPPGCSERTLVEATTRPGSGNAIHFSCQATDLPSATTSLSPWNLGQYVEDVTSGNATAWALFKAFAYATTSRLITSGIGVGAILRWSYDLLQRCWGGVPYPRRTGSIALGAKTPVATLNLQAGEVVRVKSYPEILKTLDVANKNRGLFFDAEMVPYCGKTLRVLRRVDRIINERTGEMTHFKNDCIMLEGAICEARYSEKRYLCPRAIYSFWREAWLERVPDGG